MRLIWWAAIVAGASYSWAAWMDWSGPMVTVWKGLGVGLLALWAATQARSTDGVLITIALLLGATGDVLLDAVGLSVGALAFLAGHVVAIILYLRNHRRKLSPSQRMLGRILPIATVLIAVSLVWDAGMVMAVGIYAAALGIMASTAWMSRFPRYRVGIGAVLFVLSDLLIFSRAGLLADSYVPTLLVWPLYFAGQLMIATGVVETLAKEERRA
ncbi:putative membrane protein YhhN [Stakelama sediminis]|uniref:Putative membrane protein YhhN n=1 Tax=Stakelama sediminis TaxID=463200 RepID=A0A840YZI2_9SPHN|nr:lysoplasmalogenase [Stakelama sediminis]MBB5718947.1 putative membrane protein YhhN [Stakelama sediminis]